MPSNARRSKKRERDNAKPAESCRSIKSFFPTPTAATTTTTGSASPDSVTDNSMPTSEVPADELSPATFCDNEEPVVKKSKHAILSPEAIRELKFDWLIVKEEWNPDANVTQPVLYCKLCSKHKSYAPNGNKTWADVGFKTLRKDRINNHSQSEQHKAAIRMQKQSELNSAIADEISLEEKSLAEKLIEIIYFISKNNLPLVLFTGIVDLCIKTGSSQLSSIRQSGNATYTSPQSIHSLIEALSQAVDEDLLPRIRASPTYSLMIDEVCDVSVTKNLGIITKFIDVSGEPTMKFLNNKEMIRSTGLDIKAATLDALREKDLESHRCTNLTSDGASSFSGKKNGAAALLREEMPSAVPIHCHDHRLALACRDAFKTIGYLDSVSEGLDSLFKFYKYSSVSSATLRKLQDTYKQAHWRIQQAKHHRWLSYDRAVTVVLEGLQVTREDLENAASDLTSHQYTAKHRTDARALHHFLTSEKNLRTLCLLGDVLPHLADLSLIFQRKSIDLSFVQPKLNSVLAALENKTKNLGTWENKFNDEHETINIVIRKFDCGQVYFNEHIKIPFLDNLMRKLEERFENTRVVSLLSSLSVPLDILVDIPPMFRHEDIQALAKEFNLNELELIQEWVQWLEFLQSFDFKDLDNNSSLAILGKLLLQRNSSSQELARSYPGLTHLYSIVNTLCLSSAEVERLFSHVKIIKCDKRSSLSNKCLNWLLNIKLNTEGDSSELITEAAKIWLRSKKRRFVRCKHV